MPYLSLNCPICNAVYYVEEYKVKIGKGSTCSRECSYILRGRKLEKKVKVYCDRCGKEMLRRPSCVKNKVICLICNNKPIVYPKGHKCGDWIVISCDISKLGNKHAQLCQCSCGKQQLIATHRLNVANIGAATRCEQCKKSPNYIHITHDFLQEQIVVLKRSVRDIAQELGCGLSTIARKMALYGIKLPKAEIHFLEGLRFGKWMARKKIENRDKNGWSKILYECECECGRIQNVKSDHLLSGFSMQCRACWGKSNRAAQHYQWTGCGDLSGAHFCSYRIGARERNLVFDITPEYVWHLFLKQNRMCAISGLPLDIKFTSAGTASLDRIDPNRGYTQDNVQWVHKIINKMKWDLTKEEFVYFCRCVATSREPESIGENDILESRWSKDKNEGPFCYRWKGYKGISGDYWSKLKHGAKRRGIVFDVSIQQAWDLYLRQSGCCFYTGLPISLKRNCRDKSWDASIDRIESNREYTIDNICWTHIEVNKMKNNLPLADFIRWCKIIAN